MSCGLFKKFLIGFFIANILCLLYTIFVGTTAIADELEHIHVSWLVWNGQVPYIDFFEHHHSLMWYLFAPLTGLFEGNIFIFYIIRAIMAICSLLTLYIVFKLIKKHLADDIAAWLTLDIFCFSTIALNAMVQFKPDIFMHMFFWLGVYYFFEYLKDKKQLQLNLCTLFCTISFLFLQTAIFLILPIALISLYLLYKKTLSLKHCILSSVLPLIMIISCILLMYCNGSLQRYYELNWVVNSHIFDNLKDNRVINFSDLYIVIFCGICSAIYLITTKPNQAFYILLFMYICELLLRVFYISIASYYFKIVLLYNAILIGMALSHIELKKNIISYVCIILFIPCLLKLFPWQNPKYDPNEFQVTTILGVIADITVNSERSDSVLGTNMMPFGTFNQNPHYYWFSWSYIGKIDEELHHYAPPFDINKILIENKPKFVYFENNLKQNYIPQTQYDIDPSVLQQFYSNAKYNTLYIRQN